MTMRRFINLKRVEARRIYLTYFIVILAYVICQTMSSTKFLSSTMRGMLVPICAYMVMAVSLNLVVGISGELSLGHAGFMSVGAFSGVASAILMQNFIQIPKKKFNLVKKIIAAFHSGGANIFPQGQSRETPAYTFYRRVG